MKNTLGELVLATLLTILIIYTGISFFPLAIFLAPVALVALGVRKGIGMSLVGAALSLFAIFIIADLSMAIAMVPIMLTALPLVYWTRKRKSSTKVIIRTSLTMALISFAALAFIYMTYEGNLISDIETRLIEGINSQFDLLEGSIIAMDQSLDIERLRDMTTSLIQGLMVVFPALIIVENFILACLNYYGSSLIIRRSDSDYRMDYFRFFKLPPSFSKGILYGALAVLALYIGGFSHIEELGLNLGLIITTAFTVQGLAVLVDFFVDKSKFLTGLLIVGIFVFGLYFALAFLGLAEEIFNIRFRRRKKDG